MRQLPGSLTWEVRSCLSPGFYKVRLGAFQERFKYSLQGWKSGPMSLWVRKYIPIPQRYSVTKLCKTGDSLSSTQKPACQGDLSPFSGTGQPRGAMLRHEPPFFLSSKSAMLWIHITTTGTVINPLLHPMGWPRQRSTLSVSFHWALSFPKKNVSDTNTHMKSLCHLLPFHKYTHHKQSHPSLAPEILTLEFFHRHVQEHNDQPPSFLRATAPPGI